MDSSKVKKAKLENRFLDLTTRELVDSVYGKDNSHCTWKFKEAAGKIHLSTDLRVCFVSNEDLSPLIHWFYVDVNHEEVPHTALPFQWEISKQQESLFVHTLVCFKSLVCFKLLNCLKGNAKSTDSTYYLTITKRPKGTVPPMRVLLTYNNVVTEVDYQEQIETNQMDSCSDHTYIYGTLRVMNQEGLVLFMSPSLDHFKISDPQSLKICHENISSRLNQELLPYRVFRKKHRGLAVIPLTITMLLRKIILNDEQDIVLITANGIRWFKNIDLESPELSLLDCCNDDWLNTLNQLPDHMKAGNPCQTRIIIYHQDLVATKLSTLPSFLINCTWEVWDCNPAISRNRKTDIPIPHHILPAIGPHCEFRFWSHHEPHPYVFNNKCVALPVLLDPPTLMTTVPFICVKEEVCVSFENKTYKSPFMLAERLFKFVRRSSGRECLRWKFYEENADVLDTLIFSLTRTHEGWVRELIRHFAHMYNTLSVWDGCHRHSLDSLLTMLITAPQFQDFGPVDPTHERCKLLKADMTFIDPITPLAKNEDYLIFKLRKKGFITNDDSLKMHYHRRDKFRDLFPHGDDVYEVVTSEEAGGAYTAMHQPLCAFLLDGSPCLLLPKTENEAQAAKIIKFIDDIQEIMYYKSLSCIMVRRNIHLMKMAYAILKSAVENRMTENESVDSIILYLLTSCYKTPGTCTFNEDHIVAHALFFSDDHTQALKSLASCYNTNNFHETEHKRLCLLKMGLILCLLKFSTKTFQEVFQPLEHIMKRIQTLEDDLRSGLKGLDVFLDNPNKIPQFIEFRFIFLRFKKRKDDDYTCTCCFFNPF